MSGHNIGYLAFKFAIILNLVSVRKFMLLAACFRLWIFAHRSYARRLLGFDTVFKIDDKPDFLIFPQRFCFGNIHALDTLLYRFFRIGRAERLCAGKPFLSGSAAGDIFFPVLSHSPLPVTAATILQNLPLGG